MRGVYSASHRIDGLAAARTLLYITVATGKLVEIIRTEVTNEDVETNEQLVCCWQKVTSLGTPTVQATLTPSKMESGDASAGATVKANVTASEPTYGTIAQGSANADVHGLGGFPSLPGYLFKPDPEERPIFSSGDTWGLRLLVAPASAIDIDINVVYREIG